MVDLLSLAYHNDRSSSYRFRDERLKSDPRVARSARSPPLPCPPSPCGITKHYKYECGPSFIIRKKVIIEYSTETLNCDISSYSVVETRSQRQIGTQKSRESFGIDKFIARRETLFVKVKSRHFVVRSAWTASR